MSRVSLIAVVLLALVGIAHARGSVVDPTRPALRAVARQAENQSAFRLSSILVSPARRVVVINGVALEVGDRIDGARVIEINLDSVRLRSPEGELSLSLFPTSVRRSPGAEP